MNENANGPFRPKRLISGLVLGLVGMTLFLSGVAAMGSPVTATPIGGVQLSRERPERHPFVTAPREPQSQHAMGQGAVAVWQIDTSAICTSPSLGAEFDLAWDACQAASRIPGSSAAGGAHMTRFDLRQELAQMATVRFGPWPAPGTRWRKEDDRFELGHRCADR